ncbi:hypothetical protein ABZW32_38225 [Streptomyces sp. NPDC004667]|uniref:hypothetical protein n=1 Tax=Streptomyces sp. NPDC004667 TaxID=3154285 RepID=UPI0033BA7AEC
MSTWTKTIARAATTAACAALLTAALATPGNAAAMPADNEYQMFFNNLGDGVFDSTQAIGLQPNHAVVLT